MKPLDDDGHELDAIFDVQRIPSGISLTVESRGGSDHGPRSSRNADYTTGLELLLRRLGQKNAVLINVEVMSRVTETWPSEKRRITAEDYPLPLELNSGLDISAFRKQLGRASAALGRVGTSGGNSTKRLRMALSWPGDEHFSIEDIKGILAGRRTVGPADDGKYAPLGAHLASQTTDEIQLSLEEIEHLIGSPLPPAARSHSFWANVANHHHSRRRHWLEAGFKAFFRQRVQAVQFRRIGKSSFEPTDDPDELANRAREAKRTLEHQPSEMADEELGTDHVEQRPATTTRYVRDPKVVAWVLVEAAGRCEVCEEKAPFNGWNGEPYLEVHHVRPLAEGGPDRVSNALAACPNCHRELHHGEDRHALRRRLIDRIRRLVDYPAANVPGISELAAAQ